jgi:hypothetical protein
MLELYCGEGTTILSTRCIANAAKYSQQITYGIVERRSLTWAGIDG